MVPGDVLLHKKEIPHKQITQPEYPIIVIFVHSTHICLMLIQCSSCRNNYNQSWSWWLLHNTASVSVVHGHGGLYFGMISCVVG